MPPAVGKIQQAYLKAAGNASSSAAWSSKRKASAGQGAPASKKRRVGDSDVVATSLAGARDSRSPCHPRYTPSCARCVFTQFRSGWASSHGAMLHRTGNTRTKLVWLQEKPRHWPGPWGVGCALCAQLHHRMSLAPEKAVRHARRKFQTKWSRYEVRAVSQMAASAVAQHANTSIHKMACEAMRKPDLPMCQLLQASHSDDQLLAGSVPQVGDWLAAWRAVRSPVSFSKAEAHAHTAFYATGGPAGAVRGIERRVLAGPLFALLVWVNPLFVLADALFVWVDTWHSAQD